MPPSKIENVLILDTETTGTDFLRDGVVEIGCVLWSVPHKAAMVNFSTIVPHGQRAQSNTAEFVNGIPEAMLANPDMDNSVLGRLSRVPLALAKQADVIVAHNADFDRRFCRQLWPDLGEAAWICTLNDFVWPKQAPSGSLTSIALAHGQPVVAAHRALTDCILLARLFESIPDIGDRLEAALAYSLEPKVVARAKCAFRQNHIAKAAGFRYSDGTSLPKGWVRRCTMEEYSKLRKGAPFEIELVK